MVLVERKLFALPETSWLWLATQFLAHDWFSLSHISFEDLSVFKACLADRSISRWRDSAYNFDLSVLLFFFFKSGRCLRVWYDARICHVISCRSDRRTTVRQGKEGRYMQKTKDLPGHGIWKVRELKGRADTWSTWKFLRTGEKIAGKILPIRR